MNPEPRRSTGDAQISLDGALEDSRDTRQVLKPQQLSFYGAGSRSWIIPANGNPATAIQVFVVFVSGVAPVTRGRRYRVSFQVSLKEDAFGWEDSPVRVAAKVGSSAGFKFQRRGVDLSRGSSNLQTIPPEDQPLEIAVPPNSNDGEIQFVLFEISRRKWKGGLLVYSATVEDVGTAST